MLMAWPTVPATLEERRRLRPIGRNVERYQQMIRELRELVIIAEDLGFDAFSTTEHHFHSEGIEAAVAPCVLYADLAARTSRIKFAPLGMVLPGWDPIRAAEELAVLDHLTGGRTFAGFARGYQDRWTDVLGQQYGARAAAMDGSASDQKNRAIFEEMLEIVKLAWTQESFSYDGKYYKVPFPFEGIKRWPPSDVTEEFGAPGELDEKGVIRKICVIPKPFQHPHPPLWQPFSLSESTMRFTARNDIMPWIIKTFPSEFRRLCEVFRDEAGRAGRQLEVGQGVGTLRSAYFANTEAEGLELARASGHWIWKEWFGKFGFWEAWRSPEDAVKYPLDPHTPLPPKEWTVERLRDVKMILVGPPEKIREDFADIATVHGAGQLEWFSLLVDQGVMPFDEVKRQLILFGKEVLVHHR